ncbi:MULTISPECIES: hypothetical protein [Meridianimarinicoccus]|uniref:Uncharacterized protein n=1 Tax=Meridianimarinicoccus marinus TaxID=3231483 RepID=A0ABV3L958_9RHOB|nr:hypothetical protein [Fluviibacterium sp. MJW13]
MLKRTTVIILAILVTLVGAYLYFAYRVPAGVTPQSGSGETLALVGLATSVVGLLTSVVGLIGKVLDARKS